MITLVTDEYLKSIQVESYSSTLINLSTLKQSQNFLKNSYLLFLNFVSRFLNLKNSFSKYIQEYSLLSNLNKLLIAFKIDWSKHLMTGVYSVKAFKAQSKKTVFLLWFQNKQSIVSSNQSVVLLLNRFHHSKTVFKLSQNT